MHTATSTPTATTPSLPSSHTRALWPADPAPLHWPAPMVDGRALLAARRRADADATVRAMVAELAALCPEVST